MKNWNPHNLKDEISGETLDYVNDNTNLRLSLLKYFLNKREKYEETVSIIIQGPLNKRSISCIPDYLKYGEVIFSCWDRDDISLLDDYKDKIKIKINKYQDILRYIKRGNLKNPLIFQPYTTLQGINIASGNLCIKLRSDEKFPNLDRLIEMLKKNRDEPNQHGVYDKSFKIITSNIYFRRDSEYKFHPSDHIVAGERLRMKCVFDKFYDLCRFSKLNLHPEQILCKAVIETHWNKDSQTRDKCIDSFSKQLMKKHFDIIRVEDLPGHTWTSSYRKYRDLQGSEATWCNHINQI